ncbi:DUF1559 domain-containing protein [bacterium]|nr:DUF1559 domain-containing protein [bacterium]
MLLPALVRAREQARRGVCLSNLKQLGLILHIYAQDWSGWFPIHDTSVIYNDTNKRTDPKANASLALLTGQTIPYEEDGETPHPALDTNPYTNEYKLFICPSSGDVPSDERTDLPKGILTSPLEGASGSDYTCSYAYAYGLNIQTHTDTAIMADRKVIGGFATLGYNNTSFHGLRPDASHGTKGVNVLYVGGHAKWIATQYFTSGNYGYLPKEPFPNCGKDKAGAMVNLHPTY